MYRHALILSSYFLCVFLWLLLPVTAEAQQVVKTPQPTRASRLLETLKTSNVKMNLEQQSLDNIIALLASRLHCNILVDDQPILEKIDLKFDGTGKEALDKVTDLFDYTWQTSNNGGVLLRKRFRDPLEHQQINFLEMRQTARDAVTVLSILYTDPRNLQETWTFTLHTLFDSFTPEQRQALVDGKKLTMQQLTEPQRALAAKAVYGNAYERLCEGWYDLADWLNAMPRGWLQLEAAPGQVPVAAQPKRVSISKLKYRYIKENGELSYFSLTQQEMSVRQQEKAK